MVFFEKFKKMRMINDKREKKEAPAEKQDDERKDALVINGKEVDIVQSGRQEKISMLTPREHDLYLLLLEGFTLKESAKQLSIKYSTANTHMSGIYKKLEVNSRAELIINYRGIKSKDTETP